MKTDIKMLDFSVIDGVSIKLTTVSLILGAITWSTLTGWLSALALVTTVVYNGIRIYKELKNKKTNNGTK